MVSLLPDQKPPKPSSLVLFMIAEYKMNYPKTSGEDWFQLCIWSAETARSLVNIHQAYSGPEVHPLALIVGRRAHWLQNPEHHCPFSRAGSCCIPMKSSSSGKGPRTREVGHEPTKLTTCPRHSLCLRRWSLTDGL